MTLLEQIRASIRECLDTRAGHMAVIDSVIAAAEARDDSALTDAETIQFSEALSQEHIITRKLAPNRRILVASPAYVEAYGNPRTREELDQHACLRLTTVADWNDWIPAAVLKRPMRFEGNSAYVVYKAVLGGLGIARLSEYLVGIDVAEGRLVRVLPDYEQFDSTIVISYLDRRNLSPKIRALVDFLANHFLPIPPWER